MNPPDSGQPRHQLAAWRTPPPSPRTPGSFARTSHFAPAQNDSAPCTNDSAPRTNGFALRTNGFAPAQNDFAPRTNNFAPCTSHPYTRENQFSAQVWDKRLIIQPATTALLTMAKAIKSNKLWKTTLSVATAAPLHRLAQYPHRHRRGRPNSLQGRRPGGQFAGQRPPDDRVWCPSWGNLPR